VPSNIAEGMDRSSKREKVRFLDIEKGSTAELRTQIFIGMDIGYIPQNQGLAWIKETKEISAMLVGLMQTLQTAD
jgi:four helix bundle protein